MQENNSFITNDNTSAMLSYELVRSRRKYCTFFPAFEKLSPRTSLVPKDYKTYIFHVSLKRFMETSNKSIFFYRSLKSVIRPNSSETLIHYVLSLGKTMNVIEQYFSGVLFIMLFQASHFNFGVSRWNIKVWTFNWKVFSSTFLWCLVSSGIVAFCEYGNHTYWACCYWFKTKIHPPHTRVADEMSN